MKITKSTIKSFVKKHSDDLLIYTKSEFCGMNDCVMNTTEGGFKPAKKTNMNTENNLGYDGIWLVGGSRNYFNVYEGEYNGKKISGYEINNCCGTFYIAA